MTWFAHTRCDCGAPLTITSDSLTGATIEICDGCEYFGPARPRMDLPLRLVAPSDCKTSETTSRFCVTPGCGRESVTPRSDRCETCARLHATNERRRQIERERIAHKRGSTVRQRLSACVDGCGRPPYSRRADRCDECARRRHQEQKAQAVRRLRAREKGESVPLRQRRAS